ncbi:MAG: type II toxin-antitoxin system PemK/MazF family toxin [bacterium]
MKFEIKKFGIYLANLDPQMGTETGKTRPVIAVQTDLLNSVHPSTIICPITTKVKTKSQILRVHLEKGEGGLREQSDIVVDQIRAIDNKRFMKYLGEISDKNKRILLNNLHALLMQ